MLRDYQQRSIDMLYDWMRNNDGNPCLVLPTGAGKSHVVAALCKDALSQWPETRILMLTHVKELIEQNAEKMRQHWAGAPMGIYSASVGRKELGEPITFAGIQSIRNRAKDIGHIDLVIVDECHLISHRDEGSYRKLIESLTIINPRLVVIGLTATPYRLGHGYITEGEALFDCLIEPVTIEELIHRGFLAKLQSKVTDLKIDTSGVHKRGGEFIESELQALVNGMDNVEVVREVIKLAGDRKSWLFFCTGIKHSETMADLLNKQGIVAKCVTGETLKAEREEIINDFRAGRIRALTNANVLTTGFDYPDIDVIVMLRPTASPTLYVQMAGRGLRPKSHTDHCLVLDFAGVVQTHGPITNVRPPSRVKGGGDSPVRVCPKCDELVHISVPICPSCGFEFPAPPEKKYSLNDDDIMGEKGTVMRVSGWEWRVQTSRASGIEMLVVTYYGDLSDTPVREYMTVLHDGYAGQKARKRVFDCIHTTAEKSALQNATHLDESAAILNRAEPPDAIEYTKQGKFYNVIRRQFDAAS